MKRRASKKPPSRKKELIIYIYNVVEDEWSFLSSIQPIEKRYSLINDCNLSSECYLFPMPVKMNLFIFLQLKFQTHSKIIFNQLPTTKS